MYGNSSGKRFRAQALNLVHWRWRELAAGSVLTSEAKTTTTHFLSLSLDHLLCLETLEPVLTVSINRN